MACVETVNSLDSCWFSGARDTDYRDVGYRGDLSSLTWNAEEELHAVCRAVFSVVSVCRILCSVSELELSAVGMRWPFSI